MVPLVSVNFSEVTGVGIRDRRLSEVWCRVVEALEDLG